MVGGKVLKAKQRVFFKSAMMTFAAFASLLGAKCHLEVWKVKDGLVNEWNKTQPPEMQAGWIWMDSHYMSLPSLACSETLGIASRALLLKCSKRLGQVFGFDFLSLSLSCPFAVMHFPSTITDTYYADVQLSILTFFNS